MIIEQTVLIFFGGAKYYMALLTRVWQEIKCYFLHFGSYLESILMYFVEKLNKSDIFQVSEIFPGVMNVFWYRRAFDTDTFQRAILYQKEGYLILYPVI